jgi:signal transduction histidine kinase
VVAHHAWFRRSAASALFVLAGSCSAGLGLRDWLVFRYGAEIHPVPWTPYAGAPFVLLVGWVLLDRFVQTSRSLEAVNHGLEQRVARREAELAENFERLAALERARAASDERQRLLRELHDGVGARLVHLQRHVEAGPPDAARLLHELQDGLADMRLASETLGQGAPDLGAAVGSFLFRWDGLMRQSQVAPQWQVELPAAETAVPPYVQLQLLRVMQEALTNVLRHADARRVSLRLALEAGSLQLDVRDDGRGIEPGTRGRGLDDLQARAHSLGGQCSVETPPGGGTRVWVRLPVRATPATA